MPKVKLPTHPSGVHIMRQEHGWTVFNEDGRWGTVAVYEKCTLEEAGKVCQEFWDTGEITPASMPSHYEFEGYVGPH